jgi:signal transduction histidine kinase
VTVLLNLLDNAYKYSAEPRRIELSAYAEDGRCCFAVTDNGIGIPARQQRKIFRRFYQVERHLTRRPGGVGLGLSIVEFIVKAHGGTVRVESAPGSGSRFAVALPVAGA